MRYSFWNILKCKIRGIKPIHNFKRASWSSAALEVSIWTGVSNDKIKSDIINPVSTVKQIPSDDAICYRFSRWGRLAI